MPDGVSNNVQTEGPGDSCYPQMEFYHPQHRDQQKTNNPASSQPILK